MTPHLHVPCIFWKTPELLMSQVITIQQKYHSLNDRVSVQVSVLSLYTVTNFITRVTLRLIHKL